MAPLVNCLLLCTLFVAALSEQKTTKIGVAVYFESYSNESVQFLTKQLSPAYNELKDYLNITLVPYGKANRTNQGKFECEHGAKECLGNKAIACMLNDMALQSYDDKLKFITCTSDIIAKNFTEAYSVAVKNCTEKEATFQNNTVMACANSTKGDQLLMKYGEMTGKLQPPLESIPTIVFNGTFNANESKNAQSDFKRELCSKINGTKPKACEAACTKNKTILIVLVILALATIVIVAVCYGVRRYNILG